MIKQWQLSFTGNKYEDNTLLKNHLVKNIHSELERLEGYMIVMEAIIRREIELMKVIEMQLACNREDGASRR